MAPEIRYSTFFSEYKQQDTDHRYQLSDNYIIMRNVALTQCLAVVPIVVGHSNASKLSDNCQVPGELLPRPLQRPWPRLWPQGLGQGFGIGYFGFCGFLGAQGLSERPFKSL